MKKFLRRMNRGIALAIVLTIGLITFLVADNIGFSKQRVKIENITMEAISAFSGMNVLPEQYQSANIKLTDNIKNEKIASNKQIIEKYFTKDSQQSNNRYYTTIDSVINTYTDSIKNLDNSVGFVTKETAEIARFISIKKLSYDYAKVSFEVNYIAEYYGAPNISFLESPLFDYYQYSKDDFYGSEKTEQIDITEHIRISGKFNVDMIVSEDNGIWKIVSIPSIWAVDYKNPIVISEEAK